MSALRLISLATAALFVSSGCTLVFDDRFTRSENRCGGDRDCASGHCESALGMCVEDPDRAYAYYLELQIPADPTSGRPALTHRAAFNASNSWSLAQMPVPRPATLVGTVRADGVPVAAAIAFSPRLSLPGPPPSSIIASTIPLTTGSGINGRDIDFTTQLIPGIYDVEIRPHGDDTARLAPFRAVLEVESGVRLDIALPTELAEYRGVVRDIDGNGVDGLEVRAFETASGRLVSSVARTATSPEGRRGFFAIRVDPTASSWTLRVSAPAGSSPALDSGAAFPTVAVDPSVLALDSQGELQLLVPSRANAVCFAGTVELPSDAGMPRGAIGARVVLRSRSVHDPATGIVGSFTVQLTTVGAGNERVGCSNAPLPEGGFEAWVLPGAYDVEIHPLEEELGVFVGTATISDAGLIGHVFRMPSRARVSGIVRFGPATEVPNVSVRANPLRIPLSPPASTPEALLNRPSETLTDGRGLFELYVDRGVYDLVLEAPADSGYAWAIEPQLEVATSTSIERLIELRAPVAVTGHAQFDDDSPVERAQITAYARPGDGSDRVVPIGRATVEDGEFLLLLPPSL